MKSFRFALLLALGAVAFAAPASAWPYIDVTASEVLSVDPPRVRTTFELSFVGYGQYYWEFLVLPLGSEPAAQLYDCQAPAAWACQVNQGAPPASALVFYHDGGSTPIPPPPATFSIVTDRADPCVHIEFIDPVLAKSPAASMSANYGVDACLLVDAPVPTRPASWGSVKSLYR
jgi:hypothetical protein